MTVNTYSNLTSTTSLCSQWKAAHWSESCTRIETRDLYLADLAARCCARHVAETRRHLDLALAACGPDVAPAAVIEYRAALVADGLSRRTVNLRIGSLRTMLRWALVAGLVDANPVEGVRPLPVRDCDRRRRRRALTEPEVARVLAVASDADRGYDVAQRPLWWTLVETGIRIGEASRLRTSDLVEDLLVVTADSSKNGRERRVPLSPHLVACLAAHAGRELVFRAPRGGALERRGVGRRLDALLAAAGIRKAEAGRTVDVHALRYTAATRLLRRGVPLQVVAMVLGHRDTRMTSAIYADLDVDDLRAALAKARDNGLPSAASRRTTP
jgi:integrase